jgi:hypothetical protein
MTTFDEPLPGFEAPIENMHIAIALIEGEGWQVTIGARRCGESWSDVEKTLVVSARAHVIVRHISEEVAAVLMHNHRLGS